VLKSLLRVGRSLIAIAVFLACPHAINAQVAPTNSATIAGSVTDSAGKPVAGAKITLNGPQNATTQTNAQGQFTFVGVPFGAYQISAAAAKLGTATRVISVEGDINVAIEYEAPLSGLKVIANVSTSANARFNVTATSITQVNPQAKAFEGEGNWRKIIEQIPGVSQVGLGQGQTTFAAWPDSPQAPVMVSLNGTLPYETATLLDDMPLIGSSRANGTAGFGTDLSAYSLNAFGVADIVRGPGASAPSIVNSIGGSFVLHAPSMVSHNRYEFSVSNDAYGGWVANGLGALRWGKLSAVATYGFNNSPGPLNQYGTPPHVNAIGSSGGAPYTINGQYVLCTGACATTTLLSPNYASSSFPSIGNQSGLVLCCVPQLSAWTEHSGSAALVYAISPAVTGEAFYSGLASFQPLPYQNYTFNFTPPSGYVGSFPAGTSYLEGAGYLLGPGTVGQGSSLFEEKVTAQLGRGLLRIEALQNRDTQTESLLLPPNGPLSVQLFGGAGLCPTTPCTAANATPTVFNGGTYTVNYPQLNVAQLNQSYNRDWLVSYATPIGDYIHTGASFVKSYYNIPQFLYETIGPPLSTTVSLYTSGAISQTTNELRLFVGGNPTPKTSLDVSMYLTNAAYHVGAAVTNPTFTDSFYSYSAPRLGFVWRPTTSLAARVSAGGGFAEVPLNDLVGSNGTPTLNAVANVYTQTLTNTNLQPEKSFGFDVGTDVRLEGGMLFSFDVYRTNLFGQLYKSTTTSGTFNGLPLEVTQFGNIGQSRYEGLLLDVRHEVSRGLFWSFAGGLTRGYVVKLPAGFYNTATGTCNVTTGANCQNVAIIPGINFNGEFPAVSNAAAVIPYAQALGTIGYRSSDFGRLDLVGTYYGNNNTYLQPAFIEWDGHLSVPLSKNVALLATLRNVTNVYGSSIQTFATSTISGAPTITGLPYPLYGEQYGPRALILTSQVRF